MGSFPLNGWTATGSATEWTVLGTNTYGYPSTTIPVFAGVGMAKFNAYSISSGATRLLSSPAFSIVGDRSPINFSLNMYRLSYKPALAGSTLEVYLSDSPTDLTNAVTIFWSGCQNEALPNVEVCDNKDNDCDGTVDDSCGFDNCTGFEVCGVVS